jgi:hypothetical protein
MQMLHRKPEEFELIWAHTHPDLKRKLRGQRCVFVARKGEKLLIELRHLTSREFTDLIAYARTRARHFKPYRSTSH